MIKDPSSIFEHDFIRIDARDDIYNNPSIILGDIRMRRFNLMDRSLPTVNKIKI